MVSQSLINSLVSWFRQIYQLGSEIILIKIGQVNVSLNSFLLALAIMSILLSSLLTYAKAQGGTDFVAASESRRAAAEAINYRWWTAPQRRQERKQLREQERNGI